MTSLAPTLVLPVLDLFSGEVHFLEAYVFSLSNYSTPIVLAIEIKMY